MAFFRHLLIQMTVRTRSLRVNTYKITQLHTSLSADIFVAYGNKTVPTDIGQVGCIQLFVLRRLLVTAVGFRGGWTSGVFKGALVRGPHPFGRTAVIFVTILGLYLAPFRDKIAASSDQMRFLGGKCSKMRLRPGLRHGPRWGSLQRSPQRCQPVYC